MNPKELTFVKAFYELLDEHALSAVMIFDPDSKTVKEISSILFNGPTLQITVEEWKEKEKPAIIKPKNKQGGLLKKSKD